MASSTALSTISCTRWWRPRSPVEPMYMPGRLRTASRPSSTVIESAPYCSCSATLGHFLVLDRDGPDTGSAGPWAGRRAQEPPTTTRGEGADHRWTVHAGRRGSPADRDRLENRVA